MKKAFVLLLCLSSFTCFSQQRDKGNKTFSSGVISLGGRSTWSLFNDQGSSPGSGIGGQFRIQFADQINSDWFFDYITSPLGNYANRTDYHIGWSVLYYPMEPQNGKLTLFRPYILAGHCFDYSLLRDNKNADNFAERKSSAVQGGLGTHINLTDRFDVSLAGQYMIHLGNDIHAEEHDGEVHFHVEKGASLEGHLLLTLSLNYKIADLW